MLGCLQQSNVLTRVLAKLCCLADLVGQRIQTFTVLQRKGNKQLLQLFVVTLLRARNRPLLVLSLRHQGRHACEHLVFNCSMLVGFSVMKRLVDKRLDPLALSCLPRLLDSNA